MGKMKRNINLGYLNISDRGKRYVNDCLNHNRLSRGWYTTQFENQFAYIHGCSEAVFCNSGTSALQIALAALKEKYHYQDGDEVLVPALTFIATSNIVLQNNMKPVFVDVDPYTYNMDTTKISEKITSRTRVILPVHLFGLPCDMRGIMSHAWANNLQVLEDSCETMFASCYGEPVGSFGDMACFSTYVAHLIVGGVGGLVTSNNPELATMCRSLLAHGRDNIYLSIDDDDDASDEKLVQFIQRRYKFDRVGYSYRATELEAAIALSELDFYKDMMEKRRNNARYLIDRLSEFEEMLQLPYTPPAHEHSFMMFPLVAKEGVDREALLLHLEKGGIETRYMFPLLSQPIYQKLFPGLLESYPVAQHLEKKGFAIGIHQGLTTSDLDYVADVFAGYFK